MVVHVEFESTMAIVPGRASARLETYKNGCEFGSPLPILSSTRIGKVHIGSSRCAIAFRLMVLKMSSASKGGRQKAASQ
jgi:hypothetical protein